MFPAPGIVKNTNTIEDFKSIDKTALFKMVVDQVRVRLCNLPMQYNKIPVIRG